jgi:hypothetical protein
MATVTLTQADREALQTCIDRVVAEEPEFAPGIANTLEGEGFCKGWLSTAIFCSMHLQRKAMNLKPWVMAPAESAGDDHQFPGERPEIVAARRRLLRDLREHGISQYVADPIAELAKVPA